MAVGTNSFGHFGDGTTASKSDPVQILDSGVLDVAVGDGFSAILKTDGSLWTAGKNQEGQLGDGTFIDRNTYTMIEESGVTQVAISSYGRHMIYLMNNGSAKTVGSNNHGQLGDGRILQREAPIFIASLFDTPKIPLTDSNFHTAVDLWFDNQAEANATYGHISDWNIFGDGYVQRIQGPTTFNEDISGDVSSVTNMGSMNATS